MSEDIVREVTGVRGRYVVARDGHEAELTYSLRSPDLIVADHTWVPDVWRGQGVAAALVERMVADARAEGVKIVPRCSYVERWRARHPDWADVFSA